MRVGRRVGRLVRVAVLATPAVLAARSAFAQQELNPPPPVGATGHPIELGISAGWTDGWGNISTSGKGPNRTGIGMGGALELDAGIKVIPSLAVGVWGFGANLSAMPAVPSTANAYQAGAGLGGTVHFRPAAPQADPWLALGTGWRAEWLDFQTGVATAQHGMDLVRARLGLNLRVSPSVALSPVVGADLGMYFLQSILGGPWQAVSKPGLNTYVFAGVRATLDIPTAKPPPQSASAIP